MTPELRRTSRLTASLACALCGLTLAYLLAGDRTPPPLWTSLVFWPEALLNVPIHALPFTDSGALGTVLLETLCVLATILFWTAALFALLGIVSPPPRIPE